MKIEISRTGYPNCIRLDENTKKALKESGKKAELVKVTEIQDIMSYRVMSTLALVIDGNVKSYGKVNSIEEIKEMIE